MSFVAHDVIQIDSDDSDDSDSDMDRQLLRYLSVRAADLAAAGIAEGEGEGELEFQRSGGRVLQERRVRHFVDGGGGGGGGGRGGGRPLSLPQPRPAPPPPPPQPQTPPRSIHRSRLPKLKPTPKPTPKRDPDDMMVDATCIICYSATTNTVLIPCGHLVLCAVCCDALGATEKRVPGPKTVRCPICRKLVLDRVCFFYL